MPYKDPEAKREYQRGYMAEYMRGYRALGRDVVKTPVKTQPELRKDPAIFSKDPLSPALRPVKTQNDKIPAIPGLIMKGNQIIGVAEEVKGNKPIFPEPVILPLYNPAVHKAGDKVLIRQGKRLVEMVVPEMDVDGNLIP